MPRSANDPLSNLLALVLLALLIVAGLEWYGIDIGWRPWLACRLDGSQGLLNLGMIVGIGMLFMRSTRSAGIGLLVLTIGGMYALGLLSGVASGACSGGSSPP